MGQSLWEAKGPTTRVCEREEATVNPKPTPTAAARKHL